jgi:hypothetical protein
MNYESDHDMEENSQSSEIEGSHVSSNSNSGDHLSDE